MSGLHQHQQELLLFASAWKYYLHQQQQELLLIAAVSGTTTIFCISMEILFTSASTGTTTICSSIRKYYFFTSAWKYYLHQHQQELLLISSVSGTTTFCISMEILVASATRGTITTGISNRKYYYFTSHLFLLLHLSPPTYTHISHCPACLHHCSLPGRTGCLLACSVAAAWTCTSSRFGFDRIRLDTLPLPLCTSAPATLSVFFCVKQFE